MLSYINNSQKKGTSNFNLKKINKNEIFFTKSELYCEYVKKMR